LLGFGLLHTDDLALTLLAGLVVLVLLEAFKPQWAAKPKG
jgi:hypothetical protein